MEGDSLNRNIKILLAALVSIAGSFGVQIPESVQLAFIGLITVAVGLSNVKTMATKKAEAAAAEVKSPADAAAALGGKVVP